MKNVEQVQHEQAVVAEEPLETEQQQQQEEVHLRKAPLVSGMARLVEQHSSNRRAWKTQWSRRLWIRRMQDVQQRFQLYQGSP